jgi:hypothetical protein
MTTTYDRIFAQGVNWLAQNGLTEMSDAHRLLGVLTDTTDEWVLQAVAHQAAAIVENDHKVQNAENQLKHFRG